ncbi:MAG: xanthine dehydrogenase family protein subunit M [Candidatus Caldatribacteriota bacterium]
MSNSTRFLTQEFEYFVPHTLPEALNLLDKYKDKKMKILAGGTDLLVKMKTLGIAVDYLININEISEIKNVELDQGLTIGAAVKLSQLEKIKVVKEEYPALYEGINSMAAIAIRNMATLVGNICNASPAGDTIPPLMVYGAKLRIVSKKGERIILLEDFISGVGETVLKIDELVSQVIIPEPYKDFGSAFCKKGRVKADIAKINLAVGIERDGDVCRDCRIVLGSVFSKTLRVLQAEEILKGKTMNDSLIILAAKRASEEIKPIDDIRSTAEYRRELARVMVEDTLRIAWDRAGGKR